MITQAARQSCWKDRDETKSKPQTSKEFSAAVGRALRRAATVAGKTAYVWKKGKVIAEKP